VTHAFGSAFLVLDPAAIPPLDAPGGDAWLLDRTVRQHSRDQLVAAGLAVETVASMAEAEAMAATRSHRSIIVLDSVAFSPELLRRFLRLARASAAPAIAAALPVAVTTERLAHIDGLDAVRIDGEPAFTAPIYAVAPGAKVADARPTLVPFQERVAKLPLPIGMLGVDSLPIGLSNVWMCRVDHWVHIQRINVLAAISAWSELGRSTSGKLWFGWRLVRGFPWTRGRLTASINRIHRTAKVHYTAHVELSVIEAGAEIGPRAIVCNSWVGKGARIAAGAHVNSCVLGPGAMIADLSAVTAAVLYPRAFTGQSKVQLCVLGEGATTLTGVFFYDVNFHQNIRVKHRGRLVDSGEQFGGVCVGPWARVAGSVWVASGREIPARSLVVQDPNDVLSMMDESVMQQQMVAAVGKRVVAIGELPSNVPKRLAPGNGE
jgi:carbonic anhydrase/acetyltransferase-like protein (isoleucine patch superfamily)